MDTPSVGRVVHFVDAYSNCRAAMIVDLPVSEGKEWVRLTWFRPQGGSWIYEANVVFSEDKNPNTWHWPERV